MRNINMMFQFGYSPMSQESQRFPVTIKQCRVIEEIANKRSESLASESLNLTQSNVSRTLTMAEKALGCKVFNRGWGGSNPTTEGECVISHCNTVMREIRATERHLKEISGTETLLTAYVEWRHLVTVDVLVELGSASAAAQKLGQSQPAVSRTLSSLENMARQPLFHRRKQGLEPKEEARVLASLYRKIAPGVLAITRELENLPDSLTGSLHVGMLPFSSQDIVPKAFGTLSNEYPYLRLQAMQAPYHMLINALRKKEIDCFLGLTRQVPATADLVEVPLIAARYRLIARENHPVHEHAHTLQDLAKENWIVAPHGTPIRAYFETLFDQIGTTPPVQTIEMLTLNSAEQMILYSNGIALLVYDHGISENLPPNIKFVDIELPDSERVIGLTHRKGDESPALQHFITTLQDILVSEGKIYTE